MVARQYAGYKALLVFGALLCGSIVDAQAQTQTQAQTQIQSQETCPVQKPAIEWPICERQSGPVMTTTTSSAGSETETGSETSANDNPAQEHDRD